MRRLAGQYGLIKRLYFFIDHIGSAFKFYREAYHNHLAN
jgi:hypothetical protein